MDHPVLQSESEINAWMNTLDFEDQELLTAWKNFGEGMQKVRHTKPQRRFDSNLNTNSWYQA
jgi:hypothetical protein